MKAIMVSLKLATPSLLQNRKMQSQIEPKVRLPYAGSVCQQGFRGPASSYDFYIQHSPPKTIVTSSELMTRQLSFLTLPALVAVGIQIFIPTAH